MGIKSDTILGRVVPLGNNRNNGASLGLFCYNADNDLLSAVGSYWRARPNLATGEKHLTAPGLNRTPLRAADRRMGSPARLAVKEAHETPASRPEGSKRGSASREAA